MIYILTVTIETGKAGGADTETIEVDIADDATEKEIEVILEEEAQIIFYNHCSYGYTATRKE
jgi:hypothetical protein